MTKMEFLLPEYKDLLERFQKKSNFSEDSNQVIIEDQNVTVKEVACDWLKDNKDVWRYWRPHDDKEVLYIGGIFPLHGSTYTSDSIVLG